MAPCSREKFAAHRILWGEDQNENLVCRSNLKHFDQYHRSQNLTLALLLPSSRLPQVHLHAEAQIVREEEEGVTAGADRDYIVEGKVAMWIKIEEF